MQVNASRLLRSACVFTFALILGVGIIALTAKAANYTANLSTAVNWTATAALQPSAIWNCATTGTNDTCGVYPGQLNLSGAGIIDAAVVTSSGGTGPLSVSTLIPNPIHLTINGGTVDVATGGQLTLTGASQLAWLTANPVLSISGGTLTNSGTLALTSTGQPLVLTLNGGTFNGAGTTTLSGPSSTFNMTGTQGAMAIDQQTINSSSLLNFTASNTLTMSNGANITNAAGGTLNANGTGTMAQGAGSALVTNAGNIFKSGGATFDIGVPFVNTATAATSSTGVGMQFTGGSGPGGHNTAATWTLGGPGNTMNFGGAHLFSGAETFTGTGTITVNAGGTWTDNASSGILSLGSGLNLTNNGTLAFTGSPQNLTVAGGSFVQAATGAFQPRLGVGGNPTVSDAVNVTGAGTLAGTLAPVLAPGYTPTNGNTFTIMNCTGGCSGTFAYTPPVFPGFTFPVTYNPTSVVIQAVAITADIQVTKTGPASPITDGSPAVFTIAVKNLDASNTATGITINDSFNIGSAAPAAGCTGSGVGPLTCTVASLAPGATATFTITINTNAAGTLTNTATRTASSPADPNSANDVSSASVTVTPAADLQVSNPFTGPSSVNAGSTAAYTATLNNSGPDAAASPAFTFTLTGGGAITSGSATGFTCVPSGATMSCTAATLAVAAPVTFTINVTAPNNPTGPMTLSGTASASTFDPNAANNSGSSSAITVTRVSDISVTKSGPATVTGGTKLVYTITVTNAGPSDASTVTVTDTPATGLTFVSNSGGCTTAFPCTLALTSGQTTTITSTWALSPTVTVGTVTNTVNASSPNSDPAPGNNTATASSTAVASADVTVTKSGPATVTQGKSISYTLNVTNNGPSYATGVSLDDPTPSGLTFTGIASGPCGSFPCPLGVMANGQTITVVANYTVTASSGAVVNTATVSATSPDPNGTNNSATATATVTPQADVSISKTAQLTIVAGSNTTFSIVVSNLGPAAAVNVVIDDLPSAGLTFVSATGACSAFPCTIASIPSGNSVIISATYRVASNATTISNTAKVVSSSSPDANTSNNSATVTRSVRPQCPTTAPIEIVPSNGQQDVPLSGTIQWTNVGAGTYDVYLGPAGTGCSTLVGSVNLATSFPYSGLQPNTDYESSIIARSGTCTPLASACIRFHTTSGPCNIASPVLQSPQQGTTAVSPVQLQWSAVPGATAYHVVVSLNGAVVVDTTTPGTSLSVTVGNGTVEWSVSAMSGNCTGAASSASFTTCNPPAAPLAGVVGAPTSGQAYSVFVVDPQPGNTSYEYQEATNPQFTDATTQTSKATSMPYTHTVGAAAQVFFYRVRAFSFCVAQPGGWSKVLRVVVLPATASTRPIWNVPAGSKDLVVEQVFIPGQSAPAAFNASSNKPWIVKIVPSFGTLAPAGETLNVYIDPTQLPNGTFNASIIVTLTPLTQNNRLTTNGNTTVVTPVTINLVTPVVPVDPTAPTKNSLIVPAVGHLVGISSQWRSDIRVFNASTEKLSYVLNFISNAASDVKSTTIETAPGDTTALDDIIHNWYGFGELGDSATGVLEIRPIVPDTAPAGALETIVSSRTYNLSSVGTLGQFIPAVPFTNFVSTGTRLSLQQIAQNQNFRTNFGLVEASGSPASVVMSMFDSGGTKLFDVPVDLGGGEQKLLNGLLTQQGVKSLSDGRMEVNVTSGSGKITAYASVVDNESQDPLFVPGRPLGDTKSQLYVMPGVADLNNASASWRTDMRLFNSGTTAQTATLTFYPEGEGKTPLTTSVTINPNEVKVLDNLLQSTFATQNVGGAVHVDTAAPSQLVVTGRTYNQTASGTLGQFIPAATINDTIGVNGRALNILQVEDSMRYRTNVGLAEITGKPATVEISVVQPDTKVTPSIQVPLQANEFLQFPLSAFGLGDVYNVRVSVRVVDGGGHVTAYGSVIDQSTTAPTYVAAQ